MAKLSKALRARILEKAPIANIERMVRAGTREVQGDGDYLVCPTCWQARWYSEWRDPFAPVSYLTTVCPVCRTPAQEGDDDTDHPDDWQEGVDERVSTLAPTRDAEITPCPSCGHGSHALDVRWLKDDYLAIVCTCCDVQGPRVPADIRLALALWNRFAQKDRSDDDG